MMKKRDMIAQRIARHCRMFRCPVCGGGMRFEPYSLRCEKRHTFDLASKGYLNLLRRPVRTRYDTAMLTARQQLCGSGFFTPLIETLRDVIVNVGLLDVDGISLLVDAGCGEGSHLKQLVTALEQAKPECVQGVGLDISKDGIRLAARESWNIIWCVANLSEVPIQDRQCRMLLNMLSPANYEEFTRILATDGLLLKVVPGVEHLREFRALLPPEHRRAATPPDRIMRHFERSFPIQHTQRVTYTVALHPEQIAQALTMTPLSWNITPDTRDTILTTGLPALTVDAHVLAGSPTSAKP